MSRLYENYNEFVYTSSKSFEETMKHLEERLQDKVDNSYGIVFLCVDDFSFVEKLPTVDYTEEGVVLEHNNTYTEFLNNGNLHSRLAIRYHEDFEKRCFRENFESQINKSNESNSEIHQIHWSEVDLEESVGGGCE